MIGIEEMNKRNIDGAPIQDVEHDESIPFIFTCLIILAAPFYFLVSALYRLWDFTLRRKSRRRMSSWEYLIQQRKKQRLKNLEERRKR